MKKIILLITILFLSAFSMHNYHISLTKVVLSKQALQITMRCFIDDMETAINKTENIKSELDTKREIENVDQYFKSYLLNNFKVKLNKEYQELNFIGKEYEKDIVYFYFEIDSIKTIKSIEIENNILLKTFDDQQNIIKININNLKKTFYLKNSNPKELLKFN